MRDVSFVFSIAELKSPGLVVPEKIIMKGKTQQHCFFPEVMTLVLLIQFL